MDYVVTGALAIVPVGKTEEYLFRGAAVPRGVDGAALDHLVAVGLIAEAPEPVVLEPVVVMPVAPAGGKPLTEMDEAELRAYAEAKQIDLGKASSEDGIRAKIVEAEQV